MGRRSYYDILGIERSASADQIKRAYRELAKKYHPDRNQDPSAEERFKEVQTAYGTLSDSKKRADYDQFGEAGVGSWQTSAGGQKVYNWGGHSTINVDDLGDLFAAFGGGGERAPGVFDQFFGTGRGGGRPAPQRGTNIEHPIALSFDQAIHGAAISVTLRAAGNGSDDQTLEVKIPAGVEDRQRIRVRGKGNPGVGGGASGDLYLVCSIARHAYFKRDGADIHINLPVSITEAALGAKIDVPSLDGWATVSLPPGTPSGAKLRLRGKGLKTRGDSRRGDQYVVVRIKPPQALSDEQRRLLEQLRTLDATDPRDDAPWKQDAKP